MNEAKDLLLGSCCECGDATSIQILGVWVCSACYEFADFYNDNTPYLTARWAWKLGFKVPKFYWTKRGDMY